MTEVIDLQISKLKLCQKQIFAFLKDINKTKKQILTSPSKFRTKS